MQLKINGRKIYFSSSGSGKKLLILPGWMHDHYIWEKTQEELSRNFQVIVLDFPGFGDSQLDNSIKDLNGYAHFTKKVIEELDLNNFVILGHSFGGSVAIKTLSLFPKLPVEKLILVDSACIRKFNLKQIFGLILAKSGKPIFSLPVLRSYAHQVKNMLYGALNEHDYLNAGPLKTAMSRLIKENLEGVLDKIKIPTLIVWGENDSVTPISHAKILNHKIPKSQLIFLKNSTHWPFIEQIHDFCNTVYKFIYEK
jgi:pimeloyl-ACP methyl ester carboxylesterase